MTSQQPTRLHSQTSTPKRASTMASGQSLNHLLNFTLPPRQSQPPQSLPRRSRKHGTHQGVWNKERFVNAQYRFVMNPTGDYTVHFADPDIFFQWQDILQVIIPRSSALASAAASGRRFGQDEGHTTCPICLSPPIAPRMTKCGHVYCFPCILHYMTTSENPKWVRCPICFDSVNEKQLKCVKWYDGPVEKEDDADEPQAEASSSASGPDSASVAVPREGSTMLMRLMQRPQNTTLALPRSHTWPSDLIPPHQAPFHFLPDVFNYAKFMLATPAYLISDLTRDLDDLANERRTLASMSDELGLSFVDAAETKLKHQIAKAAALESSQLKDTVDKALRDQSEIEERFSRLASRRQEEMMANSRPSDVPEAFLAIQLGTSDALPSNSAALTTNLNRTPMTNRNPRQRRNLNPPPPSTQTYYYYQAASGLPIFLHPLDIKILFSYFNSYASFPDTITIRVESFAEGTVNDDLRKRCKYLAHMPEGTDVVFIEADLEGVVGQEGLKNFEVASKTRRARRKEKGRKDDRAKARAEEREKERDRTTASTTLAWSNVLPLDSFDRAISPVEVEEIHVPESSPQPPPTGAWGARTFASAVHSQGQGRTVSGQRPVVDAEDEYDMDAAWHEFEQRSSGGRRKRSNKLVVIGGGGGRRR